MQRKNVIVPANNKTVPIGPNFEENGSDSEKTGASVKHTPSINTIKVASHPDLGLNRLSIIIMLYNTYHIIE